jgi:hypothetical protein
MKLVRWLSGRMSRLTQLLSVGSDAESDVSVAKAADRSRRTVDITAARNASSPLRRY